VPAVQPRAVSGVDEEQRRASADEVTHRRDQPQRAVGGGGEQAWHVDQDDDTLGRARDHLRV